MNSFHTIQWLEPGLVSMIDQRKLPHEVVYREYKDPAEVADAIKDMVIRGGENVYPREVEEFLYTNPKIAEVQVFGIPDAKMGEEICAWVQLHKGQSMSAEELKDFCREQITHFKIPRHVRFVEDFPMTVTGKIQKCIMREEMQAELAN